MRVFQNVLSCVMVGLFLSSASGQAPGVRALVLPGDAAPGGSPGQLFSFGVRADINNLGHVAFPAALQVGTGGVTADNNEGMFVYENGSFSRVLTKGNEMAGIPGSAWNIYWSHRFNDQGTISLLGSMQNGPGGVTFDSDFGNWSRSSDGPWELELREGYGPTGSSAVPSSFSQPLLNNNGRAIQFVNYRFGIGGVDDSNDRAIFDGYEPWLRESDVEPDTGGIIDGLISVSQNDSFAAVSMSLQPGFGGVTDSNNHGIWSDRSGTLSLEYREGDLAPDSSGARFETFAPVTVSDDKLAFRGTLQQGPGGVDSSNDLGVWMETDSSLGLVARKGDVAPVTDGATFDFFFPPITNNSQSIAFRANLAGPADSRLSIWRADESGLHLVYDATGPAPGVSDDSVIGFAFPYLMAEDDQMVFIGSLTGPGINQDNDNAVWGVDSTGEIHLLLREGDPFEVAPGDVRTIGSLLGIDINLDMNDQGQIAYSVPFTDGTIGMFLDSSLVVPEPIANSLLPLAILALPLGRQGRRAMGSTACRRKPQGGRSAPPAKS